MWKSKSGISLNFNRATINSSEIAFEAAVIWLAKGEARVGFKSTQKIVQSYSETSSRGNPGPGPFLPTSEFFETDCKTNAYSLVIGNKCSWLPRLILRYAILLQHEINPAQFCKFFEISIASQLTNPDFCRPFSPT